jgi:hypothetical protein
VKDSEMKCSSLSVVKYNKNIRHHCKSQSPERPCTQDLCTPGWEDNIKRILKKQDGNVWNGLIWLRIGPTSR